jgi:hypothetical protein
LALHEINIFQIWFGSSRWINIRIGGGSRFGLGSWSWGKKNKKPRLIIISTISVVAKV